MGFQFMDFCGFQDFYGIYGSSMGLFPYFNRKKYCFWDFGSRISSKISASASKISACCGPLVLNIIIIAIPFSSVTT